MIEDIRLQIGQQIADLRNKKGLSQRQLEEMSGVGHAHIARIEKGVYNVRIDIVEKLANALGAHITIKEEQ